MGLFTNRTTLVLTFGAVALGGACANGAVEGVFLQLDPAATYLLTNSDPAPAAVAFQLSALGVAAGDRIELRRENVWENGSGNPVTTLLAVFSASGVLLPNADFHRVPDAIDAGVSVMTSPTYFGGEPTDIPEDFAISIALFPSGVICVIVPTGATHVFFSVGDTFFSDNTAPDSNWGVTVSLLDPCAADLDGDGIVDGADLGALLSNWGTLMQIGGIGDLDCNGVVDGADLGALLTAWGPCP